MIFRVLRAAPTTDTDHDLRRRNRRRRLEPISIWPLIPIAYLFLFRALSGCPDWRHAAAHGMGFGLAQHLAGHGGLFDTVLSEHTGSYQPGIPEDFAHLAQAVALNEYRGGLVNFPLESTMGGSAPPNAARIERGFLGSHSDIGGGFPDQDLSKVARAWMVDQARAAGVQMNDDPLTA